MFVILNFGGIKIKKIWLCSLGVLYVMKEGMCIDIILVYFDKDNKCMYKVNKEE